MAAPIPAQLSGHGLSMPLSSSPASSSEPTSGSHDGLYTGLAVVRPIRRTQLPETCMAPYNNAPACDSCRKIPTQALISAAGHRLHTIGAAKLAAANHCGLCELIVHQLDDPHDDAHDHDMIVMRVANANGTPYCQDILVVESEGQTRYSRLFTEFGIYTDEEDAASEIIPGRRMAQCPDPASSILLARAWIDASKERTGDDFDLPKALPRRLIDVGYRESPTVYLRDLSEAPRSDDQQIGRYVCLSHRWDTTSCECTTTINNIDARKNDIELCSLPLTFQDAIKITRAFGLQYIWIDTLCIIQGSELDWAEESSKMGSYYGSSWLTIGAGVHSAQGLFDQRRFDIEYRKVDLREPGNSRLYFTDRPVNQIIGNEQSSILRTRAWTFQEEVLSPRYLGFQGSQMYYRCGEYVDFESGCKEWLYPPVGSDRTEGEAPLYQDLIVEEDWVSSIVVDYSSRELSYESDRLPAISGIAHERQRLRGGRYLAGLWEEDLPRALCWSKEYAKGQCLKPHEYRAPSWSWAAIDGTIAPTQITVSEVEASVEHVSTDLKGHDPMGAVLGGLLVIRGVLRRGLVCTEQQRSSYNHAGSIAKYDFRLVDSNEDADDDIIYTFVPDTSDYPANHAALWFFNITAQVGLALFLVSSSHPQYSKNTFTRVGLIRIDRFDIIARSAAVLPDEKFRTTITIV